METSRNLKHNAVVSSDRVPHRSGALQIVVRSIDTAFSANQITSFFFVSGAYSAKLSVGARHRFSGFSQPRQCGEEVLRMLVTGGPPVRGGGGIPQRIISSSRPVSVLRMTGAG